ncbi:hypothetical protein O0L34_g1076 [Tuta absoluta]|nr:hypothetical protein O0L34_g1076 [Tuta absoluta]
MKCANAKCTENLEEEKTFCSHCQNYYHFKCANITGVGYNRKNADLKAAWRCPTCKSGGTDPGPTLNDVMLELKRFRANIEPKVSATSESLEVLKKQWKAIDSRVKRMTNVEIAGVPLKKNENLIDLLNLISSKIGFTLNSTDVDTIHRVRRSVNASSKPDDSQRSRPPAIVVQFTQRRRNDAFLAASRTHRSLSTADVGIAGPASGIFINHHLTPANKLLLKEAKIVKSTLQYSYQWVQDCKILMRKNDEPHSKIIHIKNEGDLRKLK